MQYRITKKNFLGLTAASIMLASCAAHSQTDSVASEAYSRSASPADYDTKNNVEAMVTLVLEQSLPATSPPTFTFSNAESYLFATSDGTTVGFNDDGSIDLSDIGKDGDVVIMINLDPVSMEGYAFWTGGAGTDDPYQAVGIAKYTNETEEPEVQFGSEYWNDEFSGPQLNGADTTLVFVDKDDKSDTYEYSLAVWTPQEGIGRTVIDPTISNKGDN